MNILNASSFSKLSHFYSMLIVQSTLNLSWKHENVRIGIYRYTSMLRNDKVLNDENKIALRYISLRYYLSCKIRWRLHLSHPRIMFFTKFLQKYFFLFFSSLIFKNILKAFFLRSITALEIKTKNKCDLADYKQFYNKIIFLLVILGVNVYHL